MAMPSGADLAAVQKVRALRDMVSYTETPKDAVDFTGTQVEICCRGRAASVLA